MHLLLEDPAVVSSGQLDLSYPSAWLAGERMCLQGMQNSTVIYEMLKFQP